MADDSPTHQMALRVRYSECDPMGVAHHSSYAVWFEMARTEMLRAGGGNYRDLEAEGLFLVVVKLDITYRAPARYDDELIVDTMLSRSGPIKIVHDYVLRRGDDVLATGRTTLACVDGEGRPREAPQLLH